MTGIMVQIGCGVLATLPGLISLVGLTAPGVTLRDHYLRKILHIKKSPP